MNSERGRRATHFTIETTHICTSNFHMLFDDISAMVMGQLEEVDHQQPRMCDCVVDIWAGCNPTSIIISTSS